MSGVFANYNEKDFRIISTFNGDYGWVFYNTIKRTDILKPSLEICSCNACRIKKPNELGLYDMTGNVSEYYHYYNKYKEREFKCLGSSFKSKGFSGNVHSNYYNTGEAAYQDVGIRLGSSSMKKNKNDYSSSEDEFQKGFNSFIKGNYAGAIKIFEKSVSLGSAEANTMLSFMHLFQFGGLSKDWDKIKGLALDAVALGDNKGNYILAQEFLEIESKKDTLAASKLINNCYEDILESASDGNVFWQTILGFVHTTGIGGEYNSQLGIDWLKVAADSNYGMAYYYLGLFYDQSTNSEQDKDKALFFYNKAARHGDPFAQFKLYETIGITFGKKRGLIWRSFIDNLSEMEMQEYGEYWLRKSANTGYLEAVKTLGVRYLNSGDDSDKNYGLSFIKHYAKRNDTECIYLLGSIILLKMEDSAWGYRYIPSENISKAYKYFKEAYSLGDKQSAKYLADFHLFGLQGLEKSEERFVKLLNEYLNEHPWDADASYKLQIYNEIRELKGSEIMLKTPGQYLKIIGTKEILLIEKRGTGRGFVIDYGFNYKGSFDNRVNPKN